MTPDKLELYAKTKERLRELGIENPADVIVHLAEEIEKIKAETIQEMYKKLHEKVKTIYTDENERLWYDIVELEDIDRIIEELKEGL